jgi:5-methylcytosine-specific restriction endonuclease McrA
MKKRPILKLNKHFFILDVSDWRDIVKNIFTNAVYPLDLWFSHDDDGGVNFNTLDGMDVVKSWDEWAKLDVRHYDEWLNTPKGRVRLPSVVVCSEYEKIKFIRAKFPTKRNVWERDDYVCGYTLQKLTKSNLTVDHIKPRSRGGIDSWENLITCEKSINHAKGNQTLGEARFPKNKKWGHLAGKLIKLKKQPFKPKFGQDQIVFDNWREEWYHFVSNT